MQSKHVRTIKNENFIHGRKSSVQFNELSIVYIVCEIQNVRISKHTKRWRDKYIEFIHGS